VAKNSCVGSNFLILCMWKGKGTDRVEKKKMTYIVAGAVVVVAIGVTATFLLRPKEEKAMPVEVETVSFNEMLIQEDGRPLELVGLADTEEEAMKMAEDYGIELKSFDCGIAVFTTDKSYEEITEIGKTKGLSELSTNSKRKVY